MRGVLRDLPPPNPLKKALRAQDSRTWLSEALGPPLPQHGVPQWQGSGHVATLLVTLPVALLMPTNDLHVSVSAIIS